MDVDCKLMKLFRLNQSTEQPWHSVYIFLYVVFTLASFASNALLLLALYFNYTKRHHPGLSRSNSVGGFQNRVRPKPSERTRDILVAHLATFDLLLSITMPFTALDALSKYWPLGPDTELVCRVVKSFPSIAVYSSSMIIVTIAINCCRQILYPSSQQLSSGSLKYITPFILLISILMSSPIFYYARLYHIIEPHEWYNQSTSLLASKNDMETLSLSNLSDFGGIASTENYNLSSRSIFQLNESVEYEKNHSMCKEDEIFSHEDWLHVIYCIEDWPFKMGHELKPMDRLYYSLFSLVFQLIIPCIVISVSYFLIYQRLNEHSATRERLLSVQHGNNERIEREQSRSKRRNKLMAIISSIYLISWLPLSVIGILLDAHPQILGDDIEVVTIWFMSFHLIGMASAFANPIIYGYTNKHIRKGNIATRL